jgi:hypothetical protein
MDHMQYRMYVMQDIKDLFLVPSFLFPLHFVTGTYSHNVVRQASPKYCTESPISHITINHSYVPLPRHEARLLGFGEVGFETGPLCHPGVLAFPFRSFSAPLPGGATPILSKSLARLSTLEGGNVAAAGWGERRVDGEMNEAEFASAAFM